MKYLYVGPTASIYITVMHAIHTSYVRLTQRFIDIIVYIAEINGNIFSMSLTSDDIIMECRSCDADLKVVDVVL